VAKLLRNNRYRTVEAGTVLNSASLSLLYDKKCLQKLHQMATQCYRQFKSFSPGDTKALLETAVRFRNLHFKTGSADLRLISNAQLNDIATALINRQAKTIHIHGHADIQPWTSSTQQESDALNRQLSQERAESVKYALARYGIAITRMKTYGYGSSRPIELGTSYAALAKNRRVEIEVIE
jgi:outer membrane protein OmpA-like peptidoglycan-associated protein